MRNDLRLPDLTFPGIKQGANETPLSLTRLLYRGGAATRIDLADVAIRNGLIGDLLPERIDLLRRVHEAITAKLTGGGSQATADTQVQQIVSFCRWSESSGHLLSLQNAQSAYIAWSDHLVARVRVAKSMAPGTAYTGARIVGQVLDLALERETPMLELTRLRDPRRRKSPQGALAEKQHLQSTFAFGHLLQDICDGMTLAAIWGPRPVKIPLRGGGHLLQWSRGHAQSRATKGERTPELARAMTNKQARRQGLYERSRSLHTRVNLINCRILAELLMFIGQTGMNLAQAHTLELRHFNYASDIDGYKVRDFKSRRGGEVLFEIFKEYRSHFERYLQWRRELFPEEVRLFPVMRRHGAYEGSRPSFSLIQKACDSTGVVWTPPSVLRSTRVNWLLRRSGDPDLTAEMTQHHKQTLLGTYEIPSQQRAIGEIARFWLKVDPACSGGPLVAVAPGVCDGIPVAVSSKPKVATSPDCIHASGCLWCEHHRDIDNLDYVWALACFRHLKILEMARYHPPAGAEHEAYPGDIAITRMSEKLAWFRESNAIRCGWVEEALARIDEENYHPEWSRLIEGMEGVSP